MNTNERIRQQNAERKRKQRRDDEFKRKEKQSRNDPERRRSEQLKNTEAHQTARTDKDRRRSEQLKNTEAHRTARTDKDRRRSEQLKNTEAHRTARTDKDRRRAEQEKDNEAHRTARNDKDRRRIEQLKNTQAHQTARTDPVRRLSEQNDNTTSHKLARMSLKESICFKDLKQQYESSIKIGPTIICNSCNGLWFPSSIKICSLSTMHNKGITLEYLESVCTDLVQNIHLCHTCYRDVVQMKAPKLSKINGFEFPSIPSVLQNLSTLEERMVSPRIPFMQIRPLGVDKQYGLQGNVVNVPISIDTSVNILPRAFDNTHTVQIKLKRKMCYKSHYKFEAVRPTAIINAARYLVTTPLYQLENIQISTEWITHQNDEVEDFVILEEDKTDTDNDKLADNAEDEWTEVDLPDNAITTSTLWHDQSTAIAFAPGEGNQPLSLFRNTRAEELSFPSVYCGHAREVSPNISYVDICKWELRYKDRRCCKMDKIFFMYKKRQIQMLKDQINLHLRKSRKNQNVTAGQLLNNDFVDNLCKIDDGYKFLKVDRSSPVYWEERKREVLAMIRQLGIPTLFVTFSAAETKWPELIVILMKTVKGIDISEKSAIEMDYQQKCELISHDPVTCARYFDKRIRELFRILEHTKGPFQDNPIKDSYVRVEFQHRGSPHVHCLLWMKDTPVYKKSDSNQQCIEFIDKYIAVQSSTSDDELNALISLQTHRHSFSCRKIIGNLTVCRFNFPQLPVPKTMILEPLEDNNKNKQQYNNTFVSMVLSLKNSQRFDSFASFLSFHKLTLEQYILAIRSQLKHPKVFVKRDLSDIKVNNYNGTILKLHRANMDVQFILDPYSCVQYILNYLNKAERGMSKLLKEAVEEVKAGNYSIRDRLKIVGDRYLNATEVSAQEAVYQLLSMELSRSSRGHVFINTGEHHQRYTLVKSEQQLKSLADDSTDIYQSNSIEFYSYRPDDLSNLCLADFLALYNKHKSISAKKQQKLDLNDDTEESEETRGQIFALKNNMGYIEKHSKVKIIRFRRYNIKTDEINYYREQCMLFLPWFNEQDELVNADIKRKYFDNINTIYNNSVKYVHNCADIKDFEDTYKDLAYEVEKETDDLDIQHEYTVYTVDNNASYSLSEDIGNTLPKTTVERFLTPKCIDEENYYALMQSLNLKQRQYCMHLIHRCKTSTEQILNIVFGGAGTGKSKLIKALNQSLLRVYNSQPGARAETIKVLLCAPTGKAAFNIGGMTLHSTFSLPVNQCKSDIKNLSDDLRNTLHCKLQDLKVVIIDEISMVGATMFKQVDHRLREIFHSTEKFGGVTVICFGDFHQLRPVQDRFVFQNSNSNYDSLFVNTLWEPFKAYELTEIMRQKNDLPFANALNNLAIGACTADDIALFKSREITTLKQQPPREAIRLFRTNEEVDAYNRLALSLNTNTEHVSLAEDSAEGDVSIDIKNYALHVVSNLHSTKTLGLPSNITLKEGSIYMITVNVDVEDGLVNGANGVIRKIDCSVNKPVRIWLEFFDENVGANARSKVICSQEKWTPIDMVTKDIAPMRNQNVRVRRTQFPIVPAEAITITKSQGQSYDSVVVKLSKRMLRSEYYVALSRARTAAGLFIDGLFEQPKETPTVILVEIELSRYRTSALLSLNYPFLATSESSGIKLVYHNVQSLVKHYEDIKNDPNYICADLMLFVECWTSAFQKYQFPGLNLLHGFSSFFSKASGIAIYSKVQASYLFEYKSTDRNSYFECVGMRVNDVSIIVIYNSPQSSISSLLENLDHCISNVGNGKLVILGDFNVDASKNTSKPLISYMLTKLFALQSREITTNANTSIDLVFLRDLALEVHKYDSYFSHHKAIWFTVNN